MIENEELTSKIIKAFYKVYNTLGYGFIESVYHNAMILELVGQGLVVETEKPITVYYEGKVVGNFFADLLVEGQVIVELKAKEKLIEAHAVQLINYLRATKVEIGLVFNFGKTPEFKRKFFSNENKLRGTGDDSIALLDSLFISDPFESA